MIRVSAATRQELINKSLRSTKGKQRYYRRLFSKIEYPNRALSRVDVNKWFKEDILDADISVQGETDKYTVTISFYGVWENYEGELSRKSIKDAITKAYRTEDIYVYCTCPDFCFTGDTKVKLLDGRTLTMKEIAEEFAQGKELWVYASDEKGDFKPGKVTAAWETHKVNELVRVTLDNGEVIECTPEHLFMLRDGSYEEAQNLTAGVSLMTMYLRVDRKGYEQTKGKDIQVVSVERVQCNEVPVYDLEVERWHNFRLAAGVMVHNCYRYSYVATQNGYITKHIQTIPAPIRNPHDSLGSACKHVLLCLFQSHRWITELANNTYKYIQYIKKSNPTMYKNIIAPIVEIDTQQEPTREDVSDDMARVEETDEVRDNSGAERTTDDEGA